MRHRKVKKTFSRKSAQRVAMFSSLLNALVSHGSIRTTVQKAKSLRPIAETLVTKAKSPTLQTRRSISSILTDANVRKLVNEIGAKYAQRKGGYTRIIKLDKQRLGDGAPSCIIEFV